jgi:hypothetical protein
MKATEFKTRQDRYDYKRSLIIKAYERYEAWWNEINKEYPTPPMHINRFKQRLLTMPDVDYFDTWFDEEDLVIPKEGTIRLAKINMKEFILNEVISGFLYKEAQYEHLDT